MKLVGFLLLMAGSGIGFAQDDCDQNASHHMMFQSKLTEFGTSCMQYALNRSMSLDYNRSIVLSDGKDVPLYQASRTDSPLPGGEWAVKLTDSESWRPATDGYMAVYQRPGSIMNLGPMIAMELYSLEADTLAQMPDVEALTRQVRDEYDDFEDLDFTIEPFRESGRLYLKISGKIMLIGDGLTPSDLGERIAYFYITLGWGTIYYHKFNEMEALKQLPSKKYDFWNRSRFESVAGLSGLRNEKATIPDGQWIFSQMGGRKQVQVDNFGTYCNVYIQVAGTTAATRTAAMEQLTKWIGKEKPKTVESASISLFGETPWVMLKYPLAGKKGSVIFEELQEDLIQDWGESFVEEAEDVVDDLN